jgi:hypothetical protein
MWPYTEAEQHWLDDRSGAAWPPDRQQITPQLTERLIAQAHTARTEELARISRHVARKIADSVDSVPDIIERHGMRRTYLLAERIADGLVRVVAMVGRWPAPRR